MTKRNLTITIALILMIFSRFMPPLMNISASMWQVIGIFIGTLILWMTISIDWPSILCMAMIAFVPEIKINQIFASSFGNSTFAFLLFTFMCTYALSKTTFIRRVALYFLNTKMARKGGWYFLFLYFLSVLCLGAFISPTVLVVVLIALTKEIFAILQLEKGNSCASMMMMGMVFTSGIAAGMTPIAHVFPLMSMSFYQNIVGESVSYFKYMLVGIPVALLSFGVMLLMFKWLYRPCVSELQSVDIASLKEDLPPLNRREQYIIGIFGLVIALWVLPELLKGVLPDVYTWINSYGTAMPPMLGALALFIITVDNQPLLDFKDALSNGIPWASLVMVAGTLTLASALTNEDIGFVHWITQGITPLVQNVSPIILVLVFLLWTSIETNLSSNMVTVSVVCTVAIPLTLALPNINTEALAILIGMMASYAFATPPAMATIAFVLGTGYTTTKEMAKYGFILMVLTTLFATFIGYPLGCLIF